MVIEVITILKDNGYFIINRFINKSGLGRSACPLTRTVEIHRIGMHYTCYKRTIINAFLWYFSFI